MDTRMAHRPVLAAGGRHSTALTCGHSRATDHQHFRFSSAPFRCRPVSATSSIIALATLFCGKSRHRCRHIWHNGSLRAFKIDTTGELADSGTLSPVLESLGLSHVAIAPPREVSSRLEVLHADPPVFLLPDFWPAEACDALVRIAQRSGQMRQSRATGSGLRSNEAAAVRTSSSLVLNPDVAERCGAIGAVERLREDLVEVFGVGVGPEAEYFTVEHPQVVRYEPGQKFDAHDDAFDLREARRMDYQRRATLLVYLNDVEMGGATVFEDLGLRIQPKRGTALLFFPAFGDGRPDERALHEAESAVDEKWIVQVWVGSPMSRLRRRR